ncbi:hypothetical protein KSP40_PGU006180 [Platanthera guangdongensis]|uniref:Uncharacterized protein n=1 Tax=Platanthera guangdongensis TaxID=2320717 RepID=A0ABR2MG62_9ASPA
MAMPLGYNPSFIDTGPVSVSRSANLRHPRDCPHHLPHNHHMRSLCTDFARLISSKPTPSHIFPDNSIRSWIFQGNSLYEAPLFSKSCASNASNNISKVSDLCFGLALSPGDLLLAVVRSLDANLQNPMYEKRSQRAVVEFFWTVGQSLEVPNEKNLDDCRFHVKISSSEPDLAFWETNILQNLMNSEDVNKPVVIWDTIVLLKKLRKDFPGIVENILTKWISSWFSDPLSDSPENILALFHDRDTLSRVSTREFQLLNIICRRLMLSDMEFDLYNDDLLTSDKLSDKEGKPDFWKELLAKGERELRERLVAFSFHAVLNRTANIQLDHEDRANWSPVGVAQMQQWAAISHQMIYSRLKALGSEVVKLRRRNDNGISEYLEKESCGFCSAPVLFESPVLARCQGIVNQEGSIERHKLTRCVASMRLCSVIEPLWFCICCQRQAATLPPRSFFTMRHSLDFCSESAAVAARERSVPLCPYCGVLLQRSMPDFLLSTSPV